MSVRLKLFVMMFLEFFIWGAWLPLIFGYLPSLGFSEGQQSLILNAFPAAAILAMFFSNQFADRNFAAEKFLAVSHLIGGVTIMGCAFVPAPTPNEVFRTLDRNSNEIFERAEFEAWVEYVPVLKTSPEVADQFFNELDTDANGEVSASDFDSDIGRKLLANKPVPNAPIVPFFILMLIHCVFYVPTISITNSIAFASMKDAQEEFGIVRMGGTIGWIAAAWPFTFILVDWEAVRAANPAGLVEWLGTVLKNGLTGAALQSATKWTYIVSGVASVVLAGFSLSLPHTPPKKAEGGQAESLAWLEAARLLKHPFVLVLWLVTFVDAFVHNSYFNWTGSFLGTPVDKGGVGIPGNWIMPVMSVGQIAEILTMFILGMTLKSLGWRTTMIFGILGHAARFAVYAFFPDQAWLIIVVQVLHGVCYAFFFATVYIFVDEYFPKDVRSSAQGLFNVMILGIGALVANSICPMLIQSTFKKGELIDFRGLFMVPLIAATAAAIALALFFHPPKSSTASVPETPAE